MCVWKQHLTMNNNIKYLSSCLLKVYEVLKDPELCFTYMISEFLIHSFSMLELRCFQMMMMFLGASYAAAIYYTMEWHPIVILGFLPTFFQSGSQRNIE